MKYFLDAYKKYAEFSGRASRKEYWIFTLFFYLVIVALFLADNAMGVNVLAVVFWFFSIIPYFSITARRLHDTGRSGWWQLIGLVPVVGWIILLIFMILESQDSNRYGPSPLLV